MTAMAYYDEEDPYGEDSRTPFDDLLDGDSLFPTQEASQPAPELPVPTDPSQTSGSTDRPSEIPSIADETPTRSIEVQPRSPSSPVPSFPTSGAPDTDGNADYTPTRPRSPESTPGAFTSMPSLPQASPSAMSVSLRAPYISNPAQYNPTGGGPRLRSMGGGLIRGGQGVVGNGGAANEGTLSRLLQMLLRNQG